MMYHLFYWVIGCMVSVCTLAFVTSVFSWWMYMGIGRARYGTSGLTIHIFYIDVTCGFEVKSGVVAVDGRLVLAGASWLVLAGWLGLGLRVPIGRGARGPCGV